ncbi:hypothetical protein [Thalassospira lucentensis]|nr:hypothetical protein [Thalassospira lucentensis]
MIGFSADAMTASNPLKVGQGSNGPQRLRGHWDGSKEDDDWASEE